MQPITKHFALTQSGLEITGSPTWEEWQECGRLLEGMDKAVQLAIGRWVNYGEASYGEKYHQALSVTRFAYGTLRTRAHVDGVYSHLSRARYNPELTFSHLQAAASLPEDEREELLERAGKEGWTRDDVREAVNVRRGNVADDPHATCPTCHGVGWIVRQLA